ncbi:MAG: beta-ketoacyl synthase chain length factor [Bacteroidota bacterium]
MPYINGIGLISPQPTAASKGFLTEILICTADFLKCVEPVYKTYIDPLQSRRMSRLIKMGIAAAKISIAESSCTMPGAIITGTGLGSVEDTEKILGELSREEKFLNPTPFIQSTYNTISSQVAIQLKCHHYNSTYVHRTFSFESALLDGMMLLEEQDAGDVLVGGIDEMTQNHLLITRRTGQWKMSPVCNMNLLANPTPGALPGEGAAFFVLGTAKGESTYAMLKDVKTCINLDGSLHTGHETAIFLERNNLTPADVDIVILGLNGDCHQDKVYTQFAETCFPGKPQAWYKHLCGEYHTATGFALYTAAGILKHQVYPGILHLNKVSPQKMKNILIYNHYRNINHAFILVQAI